MRFYYLLLLSLYLIPSYGLTNITNERLVERLNDSL